MDVKKITPTPYFCGSRLEWQRFFNTWALASIALLQGNGNPGLHIIEISFSFYPSLCMGCTLGENNGLDDTFIK